MGHLDRKKGQTMKSTVNQDSHCKEWGSEKGGQGGREKMFEAKGNLWSFFFGKIREGG